jgi:hypothetical protein
VPDVCLGGGGGGWGPNEEVVFKQIKMMLQAACSAVQIVPTITLPVMPARIAALRRIVAAVSRPQGKC